MGELNIAREDVAQIWVKEGTHIKTKGSEVCVLPQHGSESQPEHSFVTKSELTTIVGQDLLHSYPRFPQKWGRLSVSRIASVLPGAVLVHLLGLPRALRISYV